MCVFFHLQGTKDTNFGRDDLELSNTKHMLLRSIEHGVAPYVMPRVYFKCIFPYNAMPKNTDWAWGNLQK